MLTLCCGYQLKGLKWSMLDAQLCTHRVRSFCSSSFLLLAAVHPWHEDGVCWSQEASRACRSHFLPQGSNRLIGMRGRCDCRVTVAEPCAHCACCGWTRQLGPSSVGMELLLLQRVLMHHHSGPKPCLAICLGCNLFGGRPRFNVHSCKVHI